MIVDNALYRGGARVTVPDEGLHRHHRYSCAPGEFQWIGVHDPSAEELHRLADAFELHPLAIEDAGEEHQRPKIEQYGDVLFVVLKTLRYIDDLDAVETGEINMFVGPDFVITIRHGDGTDLRSARADLERRAGVLNHGPFAVMYAVCDRVVDEYEYVGSELETDVAEVEESIFAPTRSNDSERIYALKRELAEVRRAVLPLREPIRRFASASIEGLTEDKATYFRDVADHLHRVYEVVDTLDTLLSNAFQAYVAQIQVQQNEDMRKISAGAALVVVPTLIAGVYGMNFDQMPELAWRYGYAYALGFMVITASLLFVLFKRSNWL